MATTCAFFVFFLVTIKLGVVGDGVVSFHFCISQLLKRELDCLLIVLPTKASYTDIPRHSARFGKGSGTVRHGMRLRSSLIGVIFGPIDGDLPIGLAKGHAFFADHGVTA